MSVISDGLTTCDTDSRLANHYTHGKWADNWLCYSEDLLTIWQKIQAGGWSRDKYSKEQCMRANFRRTGPLDSTKTWSISATKDGHVVQNRSRLDDKIVQNMYACIYKSKIDFVARLKVPENVELFVDNTWVGHKESGVTSLAEVRYVLRSMKLKIQKKCRWLLERADIATQIYAACEHLDTSLSDMNSKHDIVSLKHLSLPELEDYLSRVGFNHCTSVRSRMHRAMSRGREMRRLIMEHEDEQ